MKSLMVMALAAMMLASPKTQKNVIKDENPFIIDTDFDCDVDDIAAVRIATQLDREGTIDLQGVMLCTKGSEKALHGLLSDDGYHNMKIGTSAVDFQGKSTYWEVLEPFSQTKMKAADAVRMYKYILYRCENKVTIVTTGYLTNIEALLRDKDGFNLVKEKVKAIYITGGAGYDNNLSHLDHPYARQATRYVIDRCPCDLVFISGEVSNKFNCGGTIVKEFPGDIMAKAFVAYGNYWNQDMTLGRYAWDPFTVYVAAYGPERTMTTLTDTTIVYNTKDGTAQYVDKKPYNAKYVDTIATNTAWYTQELDLILVRRYLSE